MNYREFHVWDFPDNLRIKLDKKFHNLLFGKLIEIRGNLHRVKLKFNVPYDSLKCHYKDGEIRLKYIKMFSAFLVEKGYKEFSMENIEKHVKSYRALTGNYITNPRFPIKESPKMINLVVHLLGDGYLGKGSPVYCNTCKNLRNEFKRNLQIFGNVKCLEREDVGKLEFPKAIGYILKKFYNIKFGTYEGRLPKNLSSLPIESIIEALKAMIDDEGTVNDGKIEISSYNYNLLKDFCNIIKLRLPFLDIKIYNRKKRPEYTLSIKYAGFKKLQEKYNFRLTHPKKQKCFKFQIKRSEISKNGISRSPVGKTKEKIVKMLNKKQLSTIEISEKLVISRPVVRVHLKQLFKSGILYMSWKDKEGCFWRLGNEEEVPHNPLLKKGDA